MLRTSFLKEAVHNLSAVDSGGHGQASAGQMRKRHANLQEKIQGLWNTTNLFNKGVDFFEGTNDCTCSPCCDQTLSLY